jgi:amino acid permease
MIMKQFLTLPACLLLLHVSLNAQDSASVADSAITDTSTVTTIENASEEIEPEASPQSVVTDSTSEVSADTTAKPVQARQPVAKPAKPKPAPARTGGTVKGERDRQFSTVEKDTSNTRKIKLIKRKYNHRQQVVLAIGMMIFIGIMIGTAQNMNPK